MQNFKTYVALFIVSIIFININITAFALTENLDVNIDNSEIIYNCTYGYSLLDDNSKLIYDKVKTICENFDFDISSNFFSDELNVNLDDIVLSKEEKIKILTYFTYDNPQYFWLERTHGIGDNSISLVCNKRFITKSSRDKVWKTIKTTIDNYISDFNDANLENDYEKEKFIHDIIINNTTPCNATDVVNEYYKSTIEGVFGDLKTADSSGYGKAFSLLMNATGQKCICSQCFCDVNHWISGACAVNIDSNWYWIDVFRDDIKNSVSTDFLNFSNITFKEQYIISYTPDEWWPFIYEFPQMSETKYIPKRAEKPVFVVNLDKTIQVNEGENFNLKVSIENYDNTSFVWYKNDEIINGETSDTLEIISATTANLGVYKACAICTVGENIESEFSNECVVTMSTSVKIITDLQTSMLANEGDIVIFYVSAEGENPLKYEWFKNDVALKNQTQNSIILENVSVLNSGNYKVKVTDSSLKSAQSSICNFVVIQKSQNDLPLLIDEPMENNDETMENITVPVIKLQDLDSIYQKLNSNSNNVIKCADIYFNKKLSQTVKATVEIDTSDISNKQIGSNKEFNSNMINILKSIASLNIDNPTRSFELFSKRFDTQYNFKVMTFSKDMTFPFPVKVTFTITENNLDANKYYFYYFNDEEKTLELYEKTSIIDNSTFKVELNHCCEYIISPKEITILDIPYMFTENVEDFGNDTQNPKTSQNNNVPISPIFIMVALYFIHKYK